MMDRHASCQSLLKDISDQISEGQTSVYNIESLLYRVSGENQYMDEELDWRNLLFQSQLERIYISICLLLESLGHASLLQDFKEGFKRFKGELTSLSVMPYVGDMHSEALGYLWQYHRSVSSHYGVDEKEGCS